MAEQNGNTGTIVSEPMGMEAGLDFELIEALFFAYRDFISSADRDLDALGFGRAHHRVLHFVNRDPGLTVAALLEPLAITKQSLARVLKQLVDAGLIAQRAGTDDRRQRRLYPTQAGRKLTLSLAAPQSRRIERAISHVGEGGDVTARERVRRFLDGMVGPGAATLSQEGPVPQSPDPSPAAEHDARHDAHERAA